VFGGAVIVAAWAWCLRAVGPRAHRVGLAVLAVLLAAGTVLTGRMTDLAVSGPLVLAAIALAQLAWLRPGPRPPVTPTDPVPPTTQAAFARRTGEMTGRVQVALGNEARRAIPHGARRAGRFAARVSARRPRRDA